MKRKIFQINVSAYSVNFVLFLFLREIIEISSELIPKHGLIFL